MTDDKDDEKKPHLTALEGGAQPDPERISSEELAEQEKLLRQQAVDTLLEQLPMAYAFAPYFKEENLPRLAKQLIDEQLDLINPQILPSMVDPKTSKKLIVVELVSVADPTRRCNFPAYKRLEGVTDPQLVIPQAMVYAFLTTPMARAILRMNGWIYNFMQMVSEDQRSGGIILQ